ncbi:CoB--CoM heterodisulfide reductase iron-sulfur subunit B family protein [uncultured Methanobacterium sp.]|uniref:CoB--CoM heterodisulfide reductase iron-sulfur subunit B family protein n=1 Tax=uncultured Methanobacterium sp. TaxID=176306 RepID=UPI002AA740D4|nr:CoB--CoM heterodisulfide reductase iron-sulfur subunit B family protein [uncultured Methanobacterium sp.]
MNDPVPVPQNNYYLFKSCIAGSIYPGIEIAVKSILDKIGADYTDDPAQSSCTGFGFFKGVVPIETNLALNARNLSLAAADENKNVVCVCPTSYNNLKHSKKLISKEKDVEGKIKEIFHDLGLEYDYSPEISHISDVFLARIDEIVQHAVASLSGLRVVTHHGCQYTKFFFQDVTSGTFENPTVLDNILKKFDCEVIEYSEKFLCCGGGLHNSLYNPEYSREIAAKKLQSIYQVKPDLIVTQCPGCTFNLEYYQESALSELNETVSGEPSDLGEVLGSDSGEQFVSGEVSEPIPDQTSVPDKMITQGVPVLYISELISLLLGEDPCEVGVDMHVVPVEPLLEKIFREDKH